MLLTATAELTAILLVLRTIQLIQPRASS